MSDYAAEDNYEDHNGASDSYAKETDPSLKDQVPVQGDDEQIDDPIQADEADSDQQLERDENDAIDKSNILGGDRLRHAKPQTSNQYNEGPDEDDLPAEAY